MFAAHRHVAIVAADFYLRALGDCIAAFIKSNNHCRLAAAIANCFEFLEIVRPCQQVLAALKRLTLEIGSHAISQNRNIQLVRDLAKLKYLRPWSGTALRRSARSALANACSRASDDDFIARSSSGHESPRIRLDSNSRCDLAVAVTIVKFRRQHERIHATFPVVVTGLQQRRRLAGIHGRVVKIHLGHAAKCAAT